MTRDLSLGQFLLEDLKDFYDNEPIGSSLRESDQELNLRLKQHATRQTILNSLEKFFVQQGYVIKGVRDEWLTSPMRFTSEENVKFVCVTFMPGSCKISVITI